MSGIAQKLIVAGVAVHPLIEISVKLNTAVITNFLADFGGLRSLVKSILSIGKLLFLLTNLLVLVGLEPSPNAEDAFEDG